MSQRRLTYYVSTRAEFRRMVQEQLKERCLLVPTDETVSWDDTVGVRLLVRGRALDLEGRVVNPNLHVGSKRLVGLLVDLTRAEWAALGFLERAFLDGDDEPSSDLEVPGAAIRLNRRGEATGSVPAVQAEPIPDPVPLAATPAAAVDPRTTPEAPAQPPTTPETPTHAAPIVVEPHGETVAANESTARSSTNADDNMESTFDGPPFEGLADTVDDDFEQAPSAGFDEGPGTSRHLTPANASNVDVTVGDTGGATFDQSALESARRDAVRRTIETVKPLANPRLASSSQAVEYRAEQPEKAMRADELASQASTALADGDLQQTRVLARLAVVYNPHEPEFRALSELVEHRIVQIDTGGPS